MIMKFVLVIRYWILLKTYIICKYMELLLKNELKVKHFCLEFALYFFIGIRLYILNKFDVLPSANMRSVVRNIVSTAPQVVRYWS